MSIYVEKPLERTFTMVDLENAFEAGFNAKWCHINPNYGQEYADYTQEQTFEEYIKTV